MDSDNKNFHLKEDVFSFDKKLSFFFELSLDNVVNIMNIKPRMKVLNLSCGKNLISKYIADFGALVTSVDESRELIESLKKENKYYGLDFMRMESDNLHFPENHFDITLCFFALEFFLDPRKVFSEMKRVTKKYGSIIIVIVNLESRWASYLKKKSLEFSNYWYNASFKNRGFIFSLDSENLEFIKYCNFTNPYTNSQKITMNDERFFSGKEIPGVIIAKWRKE
ncbi:MAG: class I SAM-dependent methyltransferase [Candidatus Muirbacterium halophilum]|nr:class I SAM-dependent methyltransferase [Candidatus Muirbacterium halophilum]MCK9476729.1 class I SAM-dependent methyltransferase [Candidatus Muirbacterium halophilum]